MTKDYPGEQWKPLSFDFEFTNEGRIEVSNYGRMRSFKKDSEGSIVKGSMINGYRILRLKLFKPRTPEAQARLDYLQKQVLTLTEKIKALKDAGSNAQQIADTTELRNTLQKNLSQKFREDVRARTIYYSALVHRMVADFFLKKPAPDQTIVAHLDYDKLNNRASNLKWMTPDENYAHQQKSPHVQKEKIARQHRRKEESRATKLTVTKVMLMKKMINQGKPMKQLVKQFKVTETQIIRIKKGENWADVEAAQ